MKRCVFSRGMSIILAVAFVMAMVLSGCGSAGTGAAGDSTAGAQTEQSSKQDTAAATAELKPVTLTLYSIGDGPKPDQDLVMEKVNKIVNEKINATLNWQIFDWGSYDEKVKMKIAAGEEFDMCFTSLMWVITYVQNVAKGAFKPLTKLLPEYAPTYYNTIPQKFWDTTKIKGEIYGAINYQTLVEQRAMFLKKDLVDKYGFDYKNAKVPADFEPFMQKIKENEKGIQPIGVYKNPDMEPEFLAGVTDVGQYLDVFGWCAVPFNTTDFKVLNPYVVNDIQKKAFQQMHDWYKKGYIRKDAASVQDINPDINAGKVAMWTEVYKPGVEADRSANFGFEVVAVPVTQPTVRTRSVLSGLTAVSATSKNPERSVMFLEELFKNKELYNLMAFGIEGTHYTKIDDETIEPVKDTRYYSGIAWELANQFNAFYLKGQAKGTWEATIKNNEDATPSPIAGFSMDNEKVKTEIANLQAVYDEFFPGLYTGTLDPDKYIPMYEEKLKKADPEQAVMKESQTQLDQWLKDSGKK